eukprot:3610012-Amphidinium_carterae.1
MCRVCETLTAVGGYWSIECPRTSRLWEFTPVQRLQSLVGVRHVDVDVCVFKPGPRRPLVFLTNLECLCRLGRHRCDHHSHPRTQQVDIPSGLSRRQTKEWRRALASSYPEALVAVWADAVRSQAPSAASE